MALCDVSGNVACFFFCVLFVFADLGQQSVTQLKQSSALPPFLHLREDELYRPLRSCDFCHHVLLLLFSFLFLCLVLFPFLSATAVLSKPERQA
jgi:hypothetical protein